jgi:hypothetical protein
MRSVSVLRNAFEKFKNPHSLEHDVLPDLLFDRFKPSKARAHIIDFLLQTVFLCLRQMKMRGNVRFPTTTMGFDMWHLCFAAERVVSAAVIALRVRPLAFWT